MHINFAPQKKFEFNLEALKKFRPTKKNLVVAACIVLALMVLFGIVQKVRLSSLNDDKLKIDEQNKVLQDEAQKKGISVSQTAGKTPAIRAFESRILWSEVLYDVSNAVSSSVWLDGFSGDVKERTLKLVGKASDHSTVAGFVSTLSKLDTFADVTLISSNVATDKKVSRINFEIACRLKP